MAKIIHARTPASIKASAEEIRLVTRLEHDPSTVTDLCQGFAERIYRYHLAMCGDYLQAQELTGDTLRTGLARIADFEPDRSSLAAWLLSIAQYTLFYRQGKRQRSFGLLEENLGDLFSRQGQDLALQRAQMAQLADRLRRVPRWQAEAVVLHYFAGLSLLEVSQLLHRSVAWINRAASDAMIPINELQNLSQRIHLDAGALDWLTSDLKELIERRMPVRHAWISRLVWKLALRLRANPGRVVQGIAVFIAIVGVLYYLAMQSAALYPPPPLLPAPGPAPKILSALYGPSNVLTDSPGYLMPPDLPLCEEWRNILNQSLGVPVTLDPTAPFPFRALTESDAVGSGCKLRASGANGKFQATGDILERIAKRLIDDRYIYYGDFILERGRANELVYGDDGYGKGLLFRKVDSGAILSVSWIPNDPALCQNVQAEAECNLPNTSKVYTVVLGLGQSPVYQVFNAFLSSWSSGSSAALNYLDYPLRLRISDMDVLDRLAGIERSSPGKVQFTKQVMDNNGSQLLVSVQAYKNSGSSQASSLGPPTYMILGRSSGRWVIEDISADPGFAPTSDQAILADTSGKVYLASLTGSWQRDLSAPGVYQTPAGEPGSGLVQPPRISPDSSWLSLPQAGAVGTWLLSMNKPVSEILIPHAQCLAWSPDSQRVAYVTEGDRESIITRAIPDGKENLLGVMDGEVLSLAWSPAGDAIAVEYAQAVHSDRRVVALVSLPTGAVRSLYSYLGQDSSPSTFDMLWSTDGSELWYIPSQSVITVSDAQIRPLAAEPGRDPANSLQLVRLRSPVINNGEPVITALSVDGKQIAIGYYNETRDAIDTLVVQPTGTMAAIEMIERIGAMSAMSWTREDYNLVIAQDSASPGMIWRVSPMTRAIKSIAGHANLIGTVSQLQQSSLNLAPAGAADLVSQSQAASTWVIDRQPGQSLEIQYPAGWKEWAFGRGDQAQITISNLDFGQAYNWARLSNNTLFVQIYKETYRAGVDLGSWQNTILAQNQGRSLWQPVQIGGRQGYHALARSSAENGDVYAFPEENGIIWVNKKPVDSIYNSIFEEILKRLKF